MSICCVGEGGRRGNIEDFSFKLHYAPVDVAKKEKHGRGSEKNLHRFQFEGCICMFFKQCSQIVYRHSAG